MRIVLWILLLVALFVAAGVLQDRFTRATRAERDAARASANGFGHVVIGEKSGAPLIELPPRSTRDAPATSGAQASNGASGEHVVARGESLSTICEKHYGTSRKDLLSAVARYNGIASVDSIREGQRIRLPSLTELTSSEKKK